MDANALSHLTRHLTDVAMGRKAADRVLENGRWVCVQSGEILPGTSIAILGERIAYIGPDASHCVGPETEVRDVGDRFLVPGLLDGHMHVESGMLTVTEFVRAVVPHGTTGMFIDPHEMANIFGLAGVKMMVNEAAVQPIHVWVQMPSCVPSAPGLETPGAMIGPREVAEAMTWQGIIGLGEVMNFPGVYGSDEKMHREMAETRHAGRIIGGHYASPDLGLPFHGYAAGGPEDDHEGTRLEDAVARVRQGMKVMMRYGSAWHDVASQVKAITEHGLDPRHFLLVTDDCHSGTLVHEGHMDRVLRHAIEQGLEPMTAIQMATLNTAAHFGVTREVGMLAPGRYADIVLVDDLTAFHVREVIARGRTVAEEGELRVGRPEYSYPPEIRNSVHLANVLTEDDFRIQAGGNGRVTVNVIGVVENQAPTRHLKMEVNVEAGALVLTPSVDLAKVALVERHSGSGKIQLGLVSGFGLEAGCALGSTVAHDSHHMLIVGTDDKAMAKAANTLAEQGGGQVVTRGSDVVATIELPIAGLMSDEPAEVVASKAARLLEAFQACGCHLNNANMQLSLLALVVIPALRISDLGLVDVDTFKIIPVLDPGE